MNTIQKVGGYAALVQGLLFIASLVVLFIVLPSQGFAVPRDFSNPDKSMSAVSTLVTNNLIELLSSITVVLIAVALRDRMQAAAPNHMRLAVIAASVASALFIAHSLLGFTGGLSLAGVYTRDKTAVSAAFLPFGLVLSALQSGALFAGGWAVLLWGWAGLGTKQLPGILNYILLLAGVVSILSFLQGSLGVPLSLIGLVIDVVWALWLGAVLVRAKT